MNRRGFMGLLSLGVLGALVPGRIRPEGAPDIVLPYVVPTNMDHTSTRSIVFAPPMDWMHGDGITVTPDGREDFRVIFDEDSG